MKNHLSDTSSMAITVVDPPPVQEMNSGEKKDASPSAESSGNENTNMELALQPV